MDDSDYYEFEYINLPIIELLRRNGSRPERVESVLDVGCGRARLGNEIEKLGYRVTGIDSSATACNAARRRISEVVQLDLLDFERIAMAVGERRFDLLVASDVLEHFADPLEVLRCYRRFLAPGGQLVMSVPNVAVWNNRLRLLFGRFDYAESGVMDRRHLRFFTFRTARELLAQAGFTPTRVTFEPGIAFAFLPLLRRIVRGKGDPGAILDSPLYQTYQRWILPVERAVCRLRPSLLGFRVVIAAVLSDSATAPSIRQSQN